MSFRISSRLAVSAFAGIAIVACASGGSSSSPAASTPAAPAAAPAPSNGLPNGVTTAMVAAGDSIFHNGSCQRCHGATAKGTPRGPDLTDATWLQIGGTYPEIVQLVTTGVPKDKIKTASYQFQMNPRGGTNLTDEQIGQVAAYVYKISHP